ncbi:MAG: hypothetical protein RIR62_981 [Pseudomonadota bacterium]|jgi:flagellar motor switch protein FliG
MTEMTLPLAQAAPYPAPRPLSPREKAAVIVRLLLAEGCELPLATLPPDMQADLAGQIARMRLVDRATMEAVLREFLESLEQAGLAFPDGVDGVLGLMGAHLSPDAAARLRQASGGPEDPWERITALPPERLQPALEGEAVEVAAILLSKLPVARAADLLARLPGDRARRIALAVSRTASASPDMVARIGKALLADLEAVPPRAFASPAVERVGAILNLSPAATRDALLDGLEGEDADFAAALRGAIFTYAHIPARITPRDAPKIVRAADPAALVTALAAGPAEVAEFLLSNLSQRVADSLREEVAERGTPDAKQADQAMTAIILTIRQLEGAGELALIVPEE